MRKNLRSAPILFLSESSLPPSAQPISSPTRRGLFVTLEGIDGAGKSTHVTWLGAALSQRGFRVLVTREPGGTPLGEKLRDLVLHAPMSAETEALLMFAARHEHLITVIRPALANPDVCVLCDRFTDATYAYQGGGHGVAISKIAALEAWVHADIQPDLTLLFDVAVETSEQRLQRNVEQGRILDKFEREALDFRERVRKSYLERARNDPERFRVIDSSRSLTAIRAELEDIVGLLKPAT